MEKQNPSDLPALLKGSLACRLPLLQEGRQTAVRLFNGFTEGLPALTVDLYNQTLVFFTHKITENDSLRLAEAALPYYLSALSGVHCAVLKQRSSREESKKKGTILFGSQPDTLLLENGIQYAVDLLVNQDASFYLDTRNLRAWLQENSSGKTVLNTFAYTGSLGVAALAGGAKEVTQMDRNGRFLQLALQSVRLNGLDEAKMNCSAVDFFVGVGQMKKNRRVFDLVILDPPYFSLTERGRVDLVNEAARLINKVRPLVNDGGQLVVVNNALFLSGHDFLQAIEKLGKDGYITVETMIPVPEDFTGYPATRKGRPPADPAPFNHSTKIVILKIKRKESIPLSIEAG